MSDETLNLLFWIGIGVGILALFMVIELVFRAVTRRHETRPPGYRRRDGSYRQSVSG